MSVWHAVHKNDWCMFKRIMGEAGTHPLDANDIERALECAARNGYTVYLEHLAPLASEQTCINTYSCAAAFGSSECLKVMHSYIPHDTQNFVNALNKCANNSLLVGLLSSFSGACNHAACLEFLAPNVKEEHVNYVLGFVAGQCSMDVLKVLLKYGNPKSNQSKALQKAVLENSSSQIDVLYPLSDPHVALKALQSGDSIYTHEDWMPLYERIETQRLKNVLHEVVQGEVSANQAANRSPKM